MRKFISFLYQTLPKPVVSFLGRNKLLSSLRNSILRPKGEVVILSERVMFDNIPFYFQADYKTMVKAKKYGIEVGIIRNGAQFLKKYFNDKHIVFDVGANFGYVSLALHTRLASDSKIISFEPHPLVAETLRNSIQKNSFDNIKVEEMAVGAEDSPIQINIYHSTSNVNSIDTTTEKTAVEVKQCTIDHYVQTTGLKPNFIKIDVDGYELKVIEGMVNTLKECRPILVVETNGVRDVMDRLKDSGYLILDQNLQKFNDGFIPENIYCIPNELGYSTIDS